MKICPEEGQLLLFLEGELDDIMHRAMEDHIRNCPFCNKRKQMLEEDLVFTRQHLHDLYDNVERTASPNTRTWWPVVNRHRYMPKEEGRFMKFKRIGIAAVIVLSIGLVGSLPSVQALAQNLLQVFRVEQVDVITLGPQDMDQIQQALLQGETQLDIDAFGTIQTIGETEYTQLTLESLDKYPHPVLLPADVSAETAALIMQKVPVMEFAPAVDNLNRILQSMQSDYLLPEELDGETCRLKMGEVLELSAPSYTLVQCPAPEIEVPGGVNAKELAAAMVALPVWPEQVKRQLEAVDDWEHTLLIPAQDASKVKVRGQQGVLINDAWGSNLIWQEEGMLLIVSSQDNQVDLMEIADSLE